MKRNFGTEDINTTTNNELMTHYKAIRNKYARKEMKIADTKRK